MNFLNLKGEFYNIETIPGINEEGEKVVVPLEKYTEFVEQFLTRREKGAEPIITDKNNIVKNMTFINRMEEFISFIDTDYLFFFTDEFKKCSVSLLFLCL